MKSLRLLWLLLPALFSACQSVADEVRGLADTPPLDYAVLVTGGAFRTDAIGGAGTFAPTGDAEADPASAPAAAPGADAEVIAMTSIVDLLRRGAVFQRVEADVDLQRRRQHRDQLRAGATAAECQAFLQAARDDGYDLLLVVEELADGPIEAQGINGRWPVTFATWILLGLGMFIPDHTFESRATLRVTVRELQTGRVLHDPLLLGGPIDLSLVERSDFLGIVMSILVPPFWVGDDQEAVVAAVRDVVQRRLLVSLARDLKSESVRQRLRERSIASLDRVDLPQGPGVAVVSRENLSVARLRPIDVALDPLVAARFEQALLASVRRDGELFRYQTPLPRELNGSGVQVLVGTIRGSVASATFARRP
ncbi:MAG: hypothetical protein H6838_18630 [Planctomycetes bacterium]|nr:hypothetical protein [Planctomycetota bacterium]